MNVFETNLVQCEETLRKAKAVDRITRLLTLGLFSREAKVTEAQRACYSAKTQRDQFNEFTAHATNLDDQLLQTVELHGVRVSRNTFADFTRLGAEGYPVDWESIRRSVLERDGFQCTEAAGRCDGPLQIHHIVPLSRGGTNRLENLVTLCLYHHCTKHEHLRAKYYGSLRR